MIVELTRFAGEARRQAERLGLDPGPIEFRVSEPDRIYELVAYALPVRPAHWTHGRDYWRLKHEYESGAGRLYEIIFADQGKSVAYLLDGNSLAAQKLVIAHCQGHADLDRHNLHLVGQGAYVEQVRLGTARIQHDERTVGSRAVEWMLDRALALYDQVASDRPRPTPTAPEPSRWDVLRNHPISHAEATHPWPTFDLLGFVARESRHLTPWERDVCATTRLEGLYFQQMGACKVLHEAWATWTNQRILLATDDLGVGEQIQSAHMLAAVVTPHQTQFNPYALGYALLEWLIAAHGFDTIQRAWYTETDAGLIRNWLTEEAVRALHLYRYDWTDGVVQDRQGQSHDAWIAVRQPMDWEIIRDALANELSARSPRVMVESVEAGELLLRHVDDGVSCDREWAQRATQAVADLWGAPVRFYDHEWIPLTAQPTPKPYTE